MLDHPFKKLLHIASIHPSLQETLYTTKYTPLFLHASA